MKRPYRLSATFRIGALAAIHLLLTAAAPDTRLADFGRRVLATHNAERARLGLPPLVWSGELAANASKWAAHLSRLPELVHDESLDVEGENLWRGTRGYYTPENMVQLWIDEVKVYNHKPIPHSSMTGDFEDVGHYTQVVWKTTALVGCAVADTPDGDEVMVCRYMEGGNVVDETAY